VGILMMLGIVADKMLLLGRIAVAYRSALPQSGGAPSI
jgi:hypothetical protein